MCYLPLAKYGFPNAVSESLTIKVYTYIHWYGYLFLPICISNFNAKVRFHKTLLLFFFFKSSPLEDILLYPMMRIPPESLLQLAKDQRVLFLI